MSRVCALAARSSPGTTARRCARRWWARRFPPCPQPTSWRMRRIDWLAVTLLLLFAAALRIAGLSYGGLNPDYFPSYAPYGMAHEQLPIHPDAYVMVATPVNMALRNWLDPNFFEYPSFIINANLILFELTGSLEGYSLAERDGLTLRVYAEHRLYVVARIWSLVGGMLQVACAYALARLLGGRYAALCSGLLIAVSYTLAQHGHYMKPGPLALGWMMLAAWAALMALHASGARSRWRLYLLACLATGLAATTRYNAAAVGLLVGAVGLILLWRHRSWLAWRGVFAAWLSIPVVFLAGSPYILRDFAGFWRDFSYIIGQYTTTGANVPDHFLVDHLTGLAYLILYIFLYEIGIPAMCLAGLAVALCWRGRRMSSNTRLSGLLIAGLVAAYALVAMPTVRPGHSDNLAMLIVPFLAVLAGFGAPWLVERLPTSQSLSRLAVLLLLIIQPLALTLAVMFVFTQPDTRHAMLDWVHERIEPGARFFLNGTRNLPLDEAIYPNTQQFVVYTPEMPSGDDYDYLVYSDATAFDILRSWQIVPQAVIQQQHDILAAHDAAYTRLHSIERPIWLGSEAMMNTASYYHNPGLILYCLNEVACAAVQ
ncbi:MAG: phospholipid carrier-dependent glycosyltransferase [Chloroflexi bacterium]|nr:phospholipid carrier-dependent glycosyltransferase [Chloroflexota bacterium]MXX83708.1 phospholipid carrier-dependent glycosyltransferase [Chloroflexota bacterium]MYA94259.1 phospholipid carrier-dependent glycosyltransferase [Chloroflexota bacterium]MYD39268.1 phospholipid carrier-dependent glycosyltransferase [Chloroflexota bacterium]MYE77507.1 phospholipid carrier-dependent glycosyltransferase [Chloroflexota bacterium]